jgi:parvulin-like peptidyl-prolyl isomerase
VESGRLDEAFSEAAGGLAIGEISPVVRSRFGYHLIKKIN